MDEFPLRNASILCLAAEDWWYHPPRSRRRYMEVFARHNRVLFVNSIGMRRPPIGHPDFFRRITNKLRSISRLVRQPQPSLYVFSPVALPFYDSAAVRRINALLLRFQVGSVLRALGMSRPITWIGLPTYVDLMGRFGSRLNVFHVSDKYDSFYEVRDAHVSQAFNRLARECDVVLVASRHLRDLLHPVNASTYYISQGVDYNHFAQAQQSDLALPEDLRAIAPPRIGYVGGLDQAPDYELLRYVIGRRPDWQFVLIGPYSGEAAEVLPLPNVRWLGWRDYKLVPAYLKGFDACLIPWKQDEFNAYCNPIKAKEYLAAGRQVVTTYYEEAREWESWVWVARSRDEFLAALEAIVVRGERKDVAAAREWLRSSTWEAQTARIAEILVRRMAELSAAPHQPANLKLET